MNTLWNLFSMGGYFMYPISICSIIGLWVFLEKFIHFRRATIDVAEFSAGIRNLIKSNRISESITLCRETPGPVAAILYAALLCHGKNRQQIIDAIERTAHFELPRLERNLSVLSTISKIAPLLGLLGTVSGLIKTFQIIQVQSPFIQPSALAQGIWEALLTTAFGLVVAIPAHIAFVKK